jgi:hypothetical protein
MKRLSLLPFLALFAAILTQQGAAWAQTKDTKAENWGQVATVTSAWTHITEGSTKGFELRDDYYYVTQNLTFTNTNGGAGQGSGLYVQAGRTVRLYIPAGVTLTAIGADASGTSGAGAGILLPEGSTLHIIGNGTIVATGGNAADGGNGGNGTKGEEDTQSVGTWFLGKKILGGLGGGGGNGGGGAGAGIGTAGGNGGNGAKALAADSPERPQSYKDWAGGNLAGRKGDPGEAGATAAAMGTLYIQSTITTNIQGGAKGKGGGAGKPGNVHYSGGEIEVKEIHWVKGIPIPEIDITDLQSIAGGGGGGGGAGGGGAQAIGTGGPGGGGGASGACGSGCAKNGWTSKNWGSVGAGGGEAGIGPENNSGTKGITCWFQGEDDEFADTDNHKPGGKGGSAGSVSVAKSAGAAVAPSYTASYYAIGTNPTKTEETYSVGSNTTITLPLLSGGSGDQGKWKWILSIYGHVIGSSNGHCGGPNGDVYAPGSTVDLSNIYGAIEFSAVYVGCEIDCASKTNMYWKMGYANFVANKYTVVDLKNRTLYKDGYWNTLTLPFSLSAEKLATTCLAGADIRVFKSASWDAKNHALTVNFSESNEGQIKAGVPCIIRWGEPGNAPGGTIENPSFTNVPVDLWNQEVFDEDEDPDLADKYETESGGLRFQALIAPVQLSAQAKALLLGGENKFYKPSKSIYVYATRAYFTYTKKSGISMTRSVEMDFGDGNQKAFNIDDTGVIDIEGIINQNAQRPDASLKGNDQ